MMKAMSHEMVIKSTCLIEKTGGKSHFKKIETGHQTTHDDKQSIFPPGPGKGAASPEFLSTLSSPLILDVRDPNEVEAGKGGPPSSISGSFNVPLNIDGKNQKEHLTTEAEFLEKLEAAGVRLPEDKSVPIITHCGSGGRGNKAAKILKSLGYNAHNGGSPHNIAAAMAAGYPAR